MYGNQKQKESFLKCKMDRGVGNLFEHLALFPAVRDA